MKTKLIVLKRYVKQTLLLLLILLLPPHSFASELVHDNTKPKISNIGFMAHPPKEWREKFPMCDEFLKVEWLNKKNAIGYSHYDFYVNGTKRGQMTALVQIGLLSAYNLDLYKYQREGKLQEVFSFIRDGKIINRGIELLIRHGSKEIAFFSPNIGTTLSNWSENVCIPYPDGLRMWIAEMKTAEKVYHGQELDDQFEKLKQIAPSLSLSAFKKSAVIDVRSDGIYDYPWVGTGFILSFKGKYSKMVETSVQDSTVRWGFPPTGKTCEIIGDAQSGTFMQPILTTDGKSYFLGNQCNLTELITQGKE